MKILIVDDSLMDRKIVMSLLRRSGIYNDIYEATDGVEGLKILSSHYKEIVLIVLDWQMPNMNGIDFMKSVVQIPETVKIPIIMVTASGSEVDKELARNVNPHLAGYIVKPYQPNVFLKMIQPFLKVNTD